MSRFPIETDDFSVPDYDLLTHLQEDFPGDWKTLGEGVCYLSFGKTSRVIVVPICDVGRIEFHVRSPLENWIVLGYSKNGDQLLREVIHKAVAASISSNLWNKHPITDEDVRPPVWADMDLIRRSIMSANPDAVAKRSWSTLANIDLALSYLPPDDRWPRTGAMALRDGKHALIWQGSVLAEGETYDDLVRSTLRGLNRGLIEPPHVPLWLHHAVSRLSGRSFLPKGPVANQEPSTNQIVVRETRPRTKNDWSDVLWGSKVWSDEGWVAVDAYVVLQMPEGTEVKFYWEIRNLKAECEAALSLLRDKAQLDIVLSQIFDSPWMNDPLVMGKRISVIKKALREIAKKDPKLVLQILDEVSHEIRNGDR